MLDRTIFSIYSDCIDGGQKEKAEEIVSQGIPDFLTEIPKLEKMQEPSSPSQNLGPIILEDE